MVGEGGGFAFKFGEAALIVTDRAVCVTTCRRANGGLRGMAAGLLGEEMGDVVRHRCYRYDEGRSRPCQAQSIKVRA
jgi:hypothetical protein